MSVKKEEENIQQTINNEEDIKAVKQSVAKIEPKVQEELRELAGGLYRALHTTEEGVQKELEATKQELHQTVQRTQKEAADFQQVQEKKVVEVQARIAKAEEDTRNLTITFGNLTRGIEEIRENIREIKAANRP